MFSCTCTNTLFFACNETNGISENNFCHFHNLDVYQHLLLKYFPSAEILEQESSQQENDDNTPNSDEDNDNNHINEEEGQPQFIQGMLLDNSCRRPSSVLSIGECDKK